MPSKEQQIKEKQVVVSWCGMSGFCQFYKVETNGLVMASSSHGNHTKWRLMVQVAKILAWLRVMLIKGL